MKTRALAWTLAALAFLVFLGAVVSLMFGRPICPAAVLWLGIEDIVKQITWTLHTT